MALVDASFCLRQKEMMMKRLVPTFGGIVLAVLLAFGPARPVP